MTTILENGFNYLQTDQFITLTAKEKKRFKNYNSKPSFCKWKCKCKRGRGEESKKGFNFILSHLEEPLFPRKISTYKSKNKQFQVKNKEDIIKSFKESNFVDCRISAFPILRDHYITWTPNLLFIDLDLTDFNYNKKALELAVNKTLKNIEQKLSGDDDKANPTVLWSGNGYHIIQSVECQMVLENIFAKDFLSNGKADKNHNPSFKSCLLRIPNSFNSKCLSKGESLENSKVNIIQKWNGYRPSIVASKILYDFQTYLIQKKNWWTKSETKNV